MLSKLAAATVTTALALAATGCGDDRARSASGPPSAAPTPSNDAAAQWRQAVSSLCDTFAEQVKSRPVTDIAGRRGLTPQQVLAAQEAARPSVEGFDKGLAALTAPPELAGADKALKDFLASSARSLGPYLAAAEANDQAALDKAFVARDAEYFDANGTVAALQSAGVPKNCRYRGDFR